MVRLFRFVLCAVTLGSVVCAGEPIVTFKGLDDRVNSVAFAPDGKTLVGTSGRFIGLLQEPRPGKSILWATASGKVQSTLEGHKDGVSCAVFTGDGQKLATSGYDGSVQLWNPNNGKKLGHIDGGIGPLQSVAFSSDGKLVAAGGWRGNQTEQLHEFAIWDVSSLRLVAKVPAHRDAVNAVLFMPGNTALATASSDGTAKIWSGPQFDKALSLKAHDNAVYCLALSPDGKTLATGEGDLLGKAPNRPAGSVTLWDTSTWHQRGKVSTPGAVLSLGFSPDGKLLAIGGTGPTIQIVNVSDHREVATLQSSGQPIRSVCFSHEGSSLAAGNGDGTVAILALPPNLIEKAK